MKAELFYKKNYGRHPTNNNNEANIFSEASARNQEDIKTLFNTTVRENIEKTYITQTIVDLKEQGDNQKTEKDSSAFIPTSRQLAGKTLLFTKENSIESILNNMDENFHDINDRIIDKLQKKKFTTNNYSTTDKTKADDNINMTKLKQSLYKDEGTVLDLSKKVLKANKSTNCLFGNSKSQHSLKQSQNSEANNFAKIAAKEKKLNIILKYKDMKDIVRDRSPIGDSFNLLKFSKLNQYKDLNLKKLTNNQSQGYKSHEAAKNEQSKNSEIPPNKKNHSIEILNKSKKSIFSHNAKSEKILVLPEKEKENILRNISRNKTLKQNSLISTMSRLKKENTIKIIKDRKKAGSVLKDLINIPNLNVTKTLFSNHGQSKSSLNSKSNNFKLSNGKYPNKEVCINNYFSNNNILNNCQNSRNKVITIYKTSSFASLNHQNYASNSKIAADQVCPSKEPISTEKKIFSSCIDLQKEEPKIKLIKASGALQIPTNPKSLNQRLKEQVQDLMEKEKKRNLFNKNSFARSTSRNQNQKFEPEKSNLINNLQSTKNFELDLNQRPVQVKFKNVVENTSRYNIQVELHNNMKKVSHSSSKVKLTTKTLKKSKI
jgi:hypothetical protein